MLYEQLSFLTIVSKKKSDYSIQFFFSYCKETLLLNLDFSIKSAHVMQLFPYVPLKLALWYLFRNIHVPSLQFYWVVNKYIKWNLNFRISFFGTFTASTIYQSIIYLNFWSVSNEPSNMIMKLTQCIEM